MKPNNHNLPRRSPSGTLQKFPGSSAVGGGGFSGVMMKLKYRIALALIKAGWPMRDVNGFMHHLDDIVEPGGISDRQDCFARLHFDALSNGYSNVLDVWARYWAMANCARRAVS